MESKIYIKFKNLLSALFDRCWLTHKDLHFVEEESFWIGTNTYIDDKEIKKKYTYHYFKCNHCGEEIISNQN